MAVYKRTYKSYAGALTPDWSRWLIIPRYAWRTLFRQWIITIFFLICLFYPLGAALAIYFNSNTALLAQYFPVPKGGLINVNNWFFFYFTSVQCSLGFILTALVGPGLISPDLVNNALPLYFCRPLSRAGYIAGKITVIAALISAITWAPGLLLFLLQASLAEDAWWTANSYLAGSIFFSCLLWIGVISVMALALSAWVRWKIIAGALMLVIFFIGAALRAMITQVARSDLGGYLDIADNASRIWLRLFRIDTTHAMSLEESVSVLVAFTAFFLYLIARKVRAYEVVR
jgi:ABC-2 type transport system permease protein